jgi:hypothetical protein
MQNSLRALKNDALKQKLEFGMFEKVFFTVMPAVEETE